VPSEIVPVKSRLNEVKERLEILRSNPISREWEKFSLLTEIQASYLCHHVLIPYADSLWRSTPFLQREARFPLQTKRSTKAENIEKYGMTFKHEHFTLMALAPSEILQYPSLIEAPQGLVLQLIKDKPHCLNDKGKNVYNKL